MPDDHSDDVMKMQKFSVLLFFLLLTMYSCKKKYERPDVYTTDLFADRNDSLRQTISHQEALQRSSALIVSNNLKLMDKSADSSDAQVFIYLLEDGKVKANNDTIITIPMLFLANREIPEKSDSVHLYLEKVRTHKILASQNNIRYQLIPNAPISAQE